MDADPRYNRSGSKIRWWPEAQAVYVDVLVEGIVLGKRVNGQWKRTGWEWILKKMQQHGYYFTKSQLKNKLDSMREDYQNWKKLIGRSANRVMETGCKWESDMLVASKEWWDSRIQEYPKLAAYRQRPLKQQLYGSYCHIFDPVVPSSERAYRTSSPYLLPPANPSAHPTSDEHTEGSGDSEEDLDNPGLRRIVTNSNVRQNSSGGKRKSSDTSPSVAQQVRRGLKKKKTQSAVEGIWEEINAIHLEMRAKRYAIAEHSGPSLVAALKALDTLPGVTVEDPFYMFCCNMLRDTGHRTVFMHMATPEHKLNYMRYIADNNQLPGRWFGPP